MIGRRTLETLAGYPCTPDVDVCDLPEQPAKDSLVRRGPVPHHAPTEMEKHVLNGNVCSALRAGLDSLRQQFVPEVEAGIPPVEQERAS
jgi:hypothetical protein